MVLAGSVKSFHILITICIIWHSTLPALTWQPSYDEQTLQELPGSRLDGDNSIIGDSFDKTQTNYRNLIGRILAGDEFSNNINPSQVDNDIPLLDLTPLHEEIFILEDKDYPTSLYENYSGVGQVSGISTLPSGDVAIFHRGPRTWNDKLFNPDYTLRDKSPQENLIKNDTIMIIERFNGSAIKTFGSNLFYMPHGITSDPKGNLWVTDVGRHQVMRLPTSQLQSGPDDRWFPGNLSRIWPDIILGEAFVPGSDRAHFCQPSEIEISSDGKLVFVADGYCNSRIVAFTGSGRFLTTFGEQLGMSVVHSLTLIESRNLICAADRENGRIICFRAGLNNDLTSLGQHVLTLDYPLGKVYAIESLSNNHMLVSSRQRESGRYDMAALNPFTKELKQTWTSSDLSEPHALAKTLDGQFVYAADMSKSAYKKVFKFNVIVKKM